MKLEEIQSGQSLSGVEPTRIVTVVATVKVGEGPSTQLIYRTPDGAMKERFLGRADEDSIGVASVEHPFSFDGDGSASGDHSKTCYHRDQILSFLENSEDLSPGFEELVEGTESQAVAVHDRNGNALVLRLSSSDDGFRMDQYAARTFGGFLPIPNVVRIGKSDKHAYYCLTTQAQGIQSNKLTLDELRAALANIHKALADIFKADISSMTGYGSGRRSRFAACLLYFSRFTRERTALYWAMNALKAVEWTDRHKSEIIYQWLHDNLEQRLL